MEQSAKPSQFTKDFFNQFAVSKEQLISVETGSTLTEAAQLMRKNHVGNIVVVDQKSGKKKPVGIITDRDIALEIFAQDKDPKTMKAEDIMTRSLATATLNEDLFSMIAKMKENGVNRLPVLSESGDLVGIVTSKKLLQCLVQGLQDLSAVSSQQHKKEKDTRH